MRGSRGTSRRSMPRAGMPELNRLTAHLDPPFAVVDLDAFDRNADSLVRRAGGTPIRVASKSVRVRSLLSRVLAWPGFAGVKAFSLAEALWLIETGTLPTDQGVPVDQGVLVAYPSVDRAAFAQLAASSAARRRVVVMADDDAHLDVADAVMRGPERVGDEPLRVCVDVDASNRVGRIHLGARRSPLRTAAEVSPLLRRLVASPDLTAAGLMFYDAQIAGVADTSTVVRAMQERSARELVTRRAAVVAAARDIAGEVLLVNAGETGSLHVLAGDASVTELAAGSGLFAPHLFDSYSSFTPEPAAFFVLPVVRRPGPGNCHRSRRRFRRLGAGREHAVAAPVVARGTAVHQGRRGR